MTSISPKNSGQESYAPNAPRYATDRQVAHRYGISRACVWRWAAEGVIPKPVKLAANTSRWDVRELDRCDAERAERAA